MEPAGRKRMEGAGGHKGKERILVLPTPATLSSLANGASAGSLPAQETEDLLCAFVSVPGPDKDPAEGRSAQEQLQRQQQKQILRFAKDDKK